MSKSIAVGGAQNDGFVGDVVISMLTESQFQAQRNGTWVLMDGRNVNGSRYQAITGNANIPDARGLFLRGKNNGRSDGAQDPVGERNLGSYQVDQVVSHNHTYNDAYFAEIRSGGANNVQGTGTNMDGDNSFRWRTPSGGWSDFPQDLQSGYTGGPETRPKNITVNYFIKIN